MKPRLIYLFVILFSISAQAQNFWEPLDGPYGYPTAAGFVYIEEKDTIPPVPTYTVDSSGNVTGATVTDMPENSKIRANMAMIVIDPVQSYNYNFTYDDFIPGEARTVNWGLKIIDPAKDGMAVVSFVDRRGNDSTIIIKYYAYLNPMSVKLISPKDSSDKQEASLKFVWKKVALLQYRLMIDEKPEFNKNLKTFNLTDTSKLVTGLSPVTTYYWKVLSFRNDTILGSSKTWSFTTAQGLPQKITLLLPIHETIGLKTNVNFFWEYSFKSPPNFYEIEIAGDQMFKDIVYSKDSMLTTSLLINLPKNRDYYWQVRGKNNFGAGVWTDSWKLSVTNNAPRLNFPTDNSINVSLVSTVRWEDIAAPEYHLQISTSNDFLNLVIDSNGIKTNSCDFSFTKNQIYYWRVRAIDTIPEDWSEVWKFETIPDSPSAFDLINPPDKSERLESNPTLRWTSAGKYINYSVSVSLDSNFNHDLSVFTVKEEKFTYSYVPGLVYYWKVKAKNISGEAKSNQIWSFKSGSILSVDNPKPESYIFLSPNPASDFIEISVGANSRSPLQSDVRIYDVLGEIQTTPSLRDTPPWKGGEKARIDVSGLAPGMYFVRMGDKVGKFVKI